jgi:hypothetical protein
MLKRWMPMFQPDIGLQVDGITARFGSQSQLAATDQVEDGYIIKVGTIGCLTFGGLQHCGFGCARESINLGCNDLIICSKSQELALKP